MTKNKEIYIGGKLLKQAHKISGDLIALGTFIISSNQTIQEFIKTISDWHPIE